MTDAKRLHDAEQYVAAARMTGAAAGAIYEEAIKSMPHDAAMGAVVAYIAGIMRMMRPLAPEAE